MVADYIVNKIPFPTFEQRRPIALPDMQHVLHKDIDERINDHHEAFRKIAYKPPLTNQSLRHMGVMMDAWHARYNQLRMMKAKTQMTGQGTQVHYGRRQPGERDPRPCEHQPGKLWRT